MGWKRDMLLEAVGGEKVQELYGMGIRFVIDMDIEVTGNEKFMRSGCCQGQEG